MGEGSQSTTPAASEARKRRKAIIESQRKESEQQNISNVASDVSDSNSVTGEDDKSAIESNKKGRKRKGSNSSNGSFENNDKNKRAQIRYDPDVPMNKEQLAAWRREARRVRNRESAAASRQRIRNRIAELESEVAEWKAKYEAAMKQIRAYESKQHGESSTLPDTKSVENADESVPSVAPKNSVKEVAGRTSKRDRKVTPKTDSSKPRATQKSGKSLKTGEDKLINPAPSINAVGSSENSPSESNLASLKASENTITTLEGVQRPDSPSDQSGQQLAAAAAALAKAAEAMASFHSNGSTKSEKSS